MKHKEIKFGYLCNSRDLNIDYQLNKQLYDNIGKNFDSFHVINLVKIIEKKNHKKKINFFPKNFQIFTPSTYSELNKYLKSYNFYTFIALGREIKYLRTLYILKKNNVKLMLNFSTGVIPKKNLNKISDNNIFFRTAPRLYHFFSDY